MQCLGGPGLNQGSYITRLRNHKHLRSLHYLRNGKSSPPLKLFPNSILFVSTTIYNTGCFNHFLVDSWLMVESACISTEQPNVHLIPACFSQQLKCWLILSFSGWFLVDDVSTRFGFLIATKCVPMILLSEREQYSHRTFGLAWRRAEYLPDRGEVSSQTWYSCYMSTSDTKPTRIQQTKRK